MGITMIIDDDYDGGGGHESDCDSSGGDDECVSGSREVHLVGRMIILMRIILTLGKIIRFTKWMMIRLKDDQIDRSDDDNIDKVEDDQINYEGERITYT